MIDLLFIEVVEVADVSIHEVAALKFIAGRRFVRQRAVIARVSATCALVCDPSPHLLQVDPVGWLRAATVKDVGGVAGVPNTLSHYLLVLLLSRQVSVVLVALLIGEILHIRWVRPLLLVLRLLAS